MGRETAKCPYCGYSGAFFENERFVCASCPDGGKNVPKEEARAAIEAKFLAAQEAQATPEAAPVASWPELAPEALYGLAGDIVRAIEPHTEADPVALLGQFLVAFGNVVGRGPHFMAEADRHGLNLFLVLVGISAKGRKGTSWGHIRRLFETVVPDWARACLASGLSSGEGLIWQVRDPIKREEPIKEKGQITGYQTVIEDSGVEDKRLLVQEAEFASTLRVMQRDGNTLSAVIRDAWDGRSLRVLTKANNTRATEPHISIIAHVTKDELLRYLDSTEAGNGFANRFLWLCVRRSKLLPEGGSISQVDFAPLVARLRQAVTFAQQGRELKRDEEARQVWYAVYPALAEGKPGLLGAVTARAEAQVMRLACLYALLDLSDVIRREHLEAALALWEYAEDSARFIFGDNLGDPIGDTILAALRANPQGLTRTEIRDLFQRHAREEQIARALINLEAAGLARQTSEATGGRPKEKWFATT